MPDRIQRLDPFNRPPRQQQALPHISIDIPAPPQDKDDDTRNVLTALMPMVSMMVMGISYSVIYSARGGGSNMMSLPMMFMGVISAIIGLITYGEAMQQKKMKMLEAMHDYHIQLDKKESRLLSNQILQKEILEDQYPSLSEIKKRILKMNLRLWEKRLHDMDFLTLRMGQGDAPTIAEVKPPDPDLPASEIRRAFNIYTRYRKLPDAPVTVALHQVDSLAIVGRRNQSLPFLYGLISQVITHCSPEDLGIFLFSSVQFYKAWEWMRWIPHTNQFGGLGSTISFTREHNKRLFSHLSKVLDERGSKRKDDSNINPEQKTDALSMPDQFLLTIFDGDLDLRSEPTFPIMLNRGSQMNSVAVFLCDILEDVPSDCKAVIEFSEEHGLDYWQVGPESIKKRATPELLSLIEMDNLTHQILTLGTVAQGQAGRIPRSVNLLQTYEMRKIEDMNIVARWNHIPPGDGLLPFPVLMGNETQFTPLSLHLAENRDGPHGLVAGTTGSGKSELLQTLVTALAVEHHPYYVTFLLIDFKGGSAFGMFKDMPHTVGTISNLDKISALRALEAIKAELIRRQQFLSQVEMEDILEYHQEIARVGHIPENWVPLPHLFIVIDEFAQLAKEMPSFLPELIATLRLGRSLGLHLIMATQRPAGAINDEMRSNLNFRICLRVQTIEDSRDVLRRPDAALLPKDLPGRAYFQVGDAGASSQFQTARVGVEYAEEYTIEKDKDLYILNFEQRINLSDDKKHVDKNTERRPTLAKMLVERMKQTYVELQATRGYQTLRSILLPPLPELLDLDEMITTVGEGYQPWWQSSRTNFPENLTVILGQVDNLANTTQPPLIMDFPGKRGSGHVAVVGGPGTGKTWFLRMFTFSLAYRYSPAEAQIYILSFAGRSLDSLTELPHVGDVVHGNEIERLSRLIRFLQNTIEVRKNRFGQLHVDNLPSYNRRHGVKIDERLPMIFVLIDNFGELRDQSFSNELEEIQKIIENGRNYGIFFVLTSLQVNSFSYKVLNLIDQRIALNLSDKADYTSFVGRLASLEFDFLPPGRGFLSGGTPLTVQLASVGDFYGGEAENDALLPQSLDAEATARKAPSSWANQMVETMKTTWQGKPLPEKIGILPTWVNLSSVLEQAEGKKENTFGLDSDSLSPVLLDWKTAGLHLLIGGPPQSGRTSILHAMVLGLMHRYKPEEAWFVLVDATHGSLKALSRLPHVLEWVVDEDQLSEQIACLERELVTRRDLVMQEKATPESFPLIFVVIDDYDLTRDAINIRSDVLSLLAKFIRRESELGIHFIISGISQNLARETDPLIKQLKLNRSGFSLINVDNLETLGGRATPSMRKGDLPIGRGYLLLAGRIASITQVAFPDAPSYQMIEEKYKHAARVTWPNPASDQEVKDMNVVSSSYSSKYGKQDEVTLDIPMEQLMAAFNKKMAAAEQQQAAGEGTSSAPAVKRGGGLIASMPDEERARLEQEAFALGSMDASSNKPEEAKPAPAAVFDVPLDDLLNQYRQAKQAEQNEKTTPPASKG